MKTKHALAVMIVSAAFLFPGQPLYAADNQTSKETIGEKTDDSMITTKVKASLMNNKATSALRTEVETNNGVVTLTGKAKNKAEKELAGKVAKKVKGVKKVDNQMTIETEK